MSASFNPFASYDIEITALNGFRGITYIDYQAKQLYENGETQTGRIYIYFQ